jgi:hypothetical protein
VPTREEEEEREKEKKNFSIYFSNISSDLEE